MKTVGKSNSCVYIYIKSMFLFYVIERQSRFSCGTIKRDIFSFVKCNFKKVHLEKKYTWCNVSYCDSFDHNIFFLIFFFFLLKYGWITMLCQLLLYSRVTQLCIIYTLIFTLFSIMVYHRI